MSGRYGVAECLVHLLTDKDLFNAVEMKYLNGEE